MWLSLHSARLCSSARWDLRGGPPATAVPTANPRSKTSKRARLIPLREELTRFEDQITARLAEDDIKVRREVLTYIQAVQRGANDKARRAERHSALLSVISPFFR